MFQCKFSLCEHVSETTVQFIQHAKLHSNTPNYHYLCGVPYCTRMYRKATVLRAHMFREHKQPRYCKPLSTPLKCLAQSCAFKCETVNSLVKHLNSHSEEGLEIKCPFRGCDCSFTVASSFASHVSRKHRSRGIEDLDDSVLDTSVPTETLSRSVLAEPLSQPEPSHSCLDISDKQPEQEMQLAVDETLFLQNLTLLYLKLQAKLLLPASTLQTIIEDFQNAHEIGLSHVLNILSEKLKVLGIPEATISNTIDELSRGDLLKLYNRGVLSTDYKRKGAFKESFNYVEPVPVFLGNDENGKECFAQYVPVQETLAALFKSESVREQYAATRLQPSVVNVYQDVKDGEGVQSNLLLKTEPSSVGLMLYQDAFEVVNPLGSGKKKHKVLAVYSTLTDILPHNRSTIDQMQLVLLCREKDFKYFGMNKVFEPLIKDLKVLEERGIVLSEGNVVKGTLVAISGDNLGSHGIVFFLENFSRADRFCRYCSSSSRYIYFGPSKHSTYGQQRKKIKNNNGRKGLG